MKKLAFYSITAMLISTLLYFNSCDSEPLISPNTITETDLEDALDDAFADDVYEEIDASVETELIGLNDAGFDAMAYQNNSFELKSTEVGTYICKVITVDKPDTTSFPKTITIDYGEGCSVVFRNDTITKKGKIIITISGPMFLAGSTRIITFDDYYVNDVKVEGTRSITFDGINDENMLLYHIKLENGKLSFPDTTTYTRNSERTRAWQRAANPLDDVIWVTGIVEGKNRRDTSYSHEVLERLMIIRCEDYRYKWTIVDGLIECTVGNIAWTIDYGNGNCDNSAVLTRDGHTEEIEIRTRYRRRARIRF